MKARPKGEKAWRKIWSKDPDEGEGYYLGYSDPEDAVYFTERRDDGYQVVRHWLAEDLREDVGPILAHEPHLMLDPMRGQALAVSAGGEKPRSIWLDEEMGGVHRMLSGAFPNQKITFYNWSADRRRFVISVNSPDHPPAFYLLDRPRKELSLLGASYPELKDAAFGVTHWTTYKARDGLEIPAYVTLPPQQSAKPRPLVVLPHGGPATRDTFSYDDLTQFLATRGYVVLRPQYRGSSGFGRAFEEAGHAEWAGKIQTDILDGVDMLAREGTIDPSRVCVVGWSFGGYAALTSTFQYPEIYKCAASIAGVTDLQMLQLHAVRRRGRNSGGFGYLRDMLGKATRETLRAGSPVDQAERFQVPVLLIHGGLDTVVSADHSRHMRNALEQAGKDVKYLEFEDDNHNLYQAANRIRMLGALETFLADHLPLN